MIELDEDSSSADLLAVYTDRHINVYNIDQLHSKDPIRTITAEAFIVSMCALPNGRVATCSCRKEDVENLEENAKAYVSFLSSHTLFDTY